MEEIIVLFLTISIVTAVVPIDNIQPISDTANQIPTVNEEQQSPLVIANSVEPRDRISGNAIASDRLNTMTSDRLNAMTSDRSNTITSDRLNTVTSDRLGLDAMTSDRLSNLQDSPSLPALNMLNEHSDQQRQLETESALNPSTSQLSTSSEDVRHVSPTDQTNDQHNRQVEDRLTSQAPRGFRNTPRVSTSDPYRNLAWNGQSMNSDNFAQAQDRSISGLRFRNARLSPMSSAFWSGSAAFHTDPYRHSAFNDQSFTSDGFAPLNSRFTPETRVLDSGFVPDPLLLSDILAELQMNELLNDQYPSHGDPYPSHGDPYPSHGDPYYPTELYANPMLDSPGIYEDTPLHLSPSGYPQTFRSSRRPDLDTHLADGLDLRLHPYAASSQIQSRDSQYLPYHSGQRDSQYFPYHSGQHDSQYLPYHSGQDNYRNTNNDYLPSERYIDRLNSISMHTSSNNKDRILPSRRNRLHFTRRGNSDSLDLSQNITPRQRNVQMRVSSQQYDPLRAGVNSVRSARTLPIQYISRENTNRIPLNRRHEEGLRTRN